jgi:hypothetical protein
MCYLKLEKYTDIKIHKLKIGWLRKILCVGRQIKLNFKSRLLKCSLSMYMFLLEKCALLKFV